jgi:transmembrane sensor
MIYFVTALHNRRGLAYLHNNRTNDILMSYESAQALIRKYLEGTATPEEEALLQSWYIETARDQPGISEEPDYPTIGNEILQKLRAEQQQLPIPHLAQPDQSRPNQPQPDQAQPDQPQIGEPRAKPVIRIWPRVAVAAAILLALSAGSLLVLHKKPEPAVVQTKPPDNDILPAGARATLTLLDGKTIQLDSARNGTVAQQGNTTIQSHDGQLIYTPGQPAAQAPSTGYNTLTATPGEHYSLVLPDGTKAWLNAGSSINYPVTFAGNERRVTVTGEVYLEIVHNPKQPFRVTVKDQTVEDLGTHLNIKAYDDDSTINTTLLEGSVHVSKGSAAATLKPGEQATIRPDDKTFRLRTIDADQAIAWKNGYFSFDRADIQTVMREMARWYDVQVIFKGALPKTMFKGKVYRNIKASEALKILSYFGAHFQIEGKTIIVTA